MNKHIDLERTADEAELAFMQAARSITSVEDEGRVKELCHEYLNVLKLKKLKRSVLDEMNMYMLVEARPHTDGLLFKQPVREAVITHIKMC